MLVDMVVIGTSLGGLQAIETLVEDLPVDFPAPVAIVLHRTPTPGSQLATILRRHSVLPLSEPQDKEEIAAGHIYIAPADYHLLVDDGAFTLTTDDPVSYARPSIDVLFMSAADAYGAGTVGVVLTGANHDGARGAAYIKAHGGKLIVQTPSTAESAVMPQAAVNEAQADYIVTLPEIAPLLVRLCGLRTCPVPDRGGSEPDRERFGAMNS